MTAATRASAFTRSCRLLTWEYDAHPNTTAAGLVFSVLPTRLLGTDSAMTIELRLARNPRDTGLGRPALFLTSLVVDAA